MTWKWYNGSTGAGYVRLQYKGVVTDLKKETALGKKKRKKIRDSEELTRTGREGGGHSVRL